MIQSKLGEVKITRPNYELCKTLNCSKSDVDYAIETELLADLASILVALSDIYGNEHAMGMWTKSAEYFIESIKGDTI